MTDFKEGFVSLNFVPTHVLTWGGWINDPSKSQWKEMILMFPGNPGVTAFYSELISMLYQKFRIPVWIVSHAGHELPPGDRMLPKLDTNTHLFDLEGQIQNKKEFIRQFVPRNCKVHLIGHSVGAYMAVRLLKDDDWAERTHMCYLLFPALEHIADTRNGWFLTKVVMKFLWLIYFLAYIFHSLPHFLGLLLLIIYFRIFGTGTSPTVKDAVMQLINPKVLRAVFFLAADEMKLIRELDVDTIKKRKDKLFVYYGDHDGWAPLSHRENLLKSVPGIKAEVCSKGNDHAFMLHKPSKLMGEVMINEIEKYRLI